MKPNLQTYRLLFSTLRRQARFGLKALALSLCCVTTTLMAQSWVAGSPPNDSTATKYFPYTATTTSNVKYGSGSSQVGDIWVPNYGTKPVPANSTNRPAVVVVHGGGGTSGSRLSTREEQICGFCAGHGYVAFNIDYPLGSVYPQNIQSWRLAVRYLRAHAAQYGIDANHIGITGGSFGGYCSAFLSGITNGQHTIEADSNSKYNNASLDLDSAGDLSAYSGNIQCGIDLYGPTDQNTSGNAGGQYSSPTTATLYNSSPIRYVHATSAPLMLAHGTADTTVDISQSEDMTNYLGQFHVPYQFCKVQGAGHTFYYYQSGGQWPPGNSVIDLRSTAFDWFDKWLLATNNAPAISIQPTSQSGCSGYSAGFSVTASGTAPLVYQWSGPAGAIAGANTATYTIASLDPTNAGSYSVVITNNSGSVTSSVVTLSVTSLNPPSISTDAADSTVLAGNPASFTVVAAGDALQYQWFGPNGAIANATNATYTITNAADTDAGTYQAIIYNSCDSLPSRLATLTVNGPPSVSGQPTWGSSTNCSGTPDTAFAAAIGTAPLSYQWYGPAGVIAGANTNTLTLTNPAVGDSGSYYLVVTNSYGSVTSSIAPLTVSPNATLTITTDAVGFTTNVGGTATFSVAVAGGGFLTYQWLHNDYDTISNNPSASTATLILTNVALADSGSYYHCLIANDCSVIGSANGVLTVIGGGTNVTTNFTGSGTWTCPAGVTSVQVQCWGGGGGGGGATSSAGRAGGGGAGGNYVSATFTVTPVNSYTVTAGAGGGGGTTSSAGCNGTNGSASFFAGSGITTLTAGGGAGGLGAQSSNGGAGAGGIGATTGNAGPAEFVGYAGGSGGNGVLSTSTGGGGGAAGSNGNGTNAVGVLAGGGAIGGGNGAAGVTATATGNPGGIPGGGGSGGYGSAKAGGAGGAGKVTITYAAGAVPGTAPAIFGQPSGVTNASGNSLSLQVTASGSSPLSYQWYDGVSPIGGQTGAIYNINSPATTDSGNYTVVITNAYGSVTSSVAVVLITNALPFITSQPQPQSVSAGATASFSVTASGSLPLSYQWLRDGSPIGSATGTTYNLSGVTTNDSGSAFAVVITNAYGAVTSSVVNLTVTAAASSGGVVIDEVYAGGGKTGAAYKYDYVVLKNISSSAVSINGWSLQHDKVGAWQAPFALPNAGIPAGGYYLIQCYNDGSSGTNGAALTPDATAPQSSVWNMSYASADAVALVNTTNVLTLSGSGGGISASAAAAAGIVDLVGGGTSTGNDYWGTGITPTGSAANAVTRKNGGCQNTPDNSLDFAAAPASPKNSATTPAPCNGGGQAPTITVEPQSQSVAAGASASFGVTATGTAPLGYQWRSAGVPLSNATNATYTINTVTTNDSGRTFDVVITNVYGAVTSSPAATLTVNVIAPELLSIEAVKAIYYVQTNTAAVIQPAGATGPYSWAAEVQGVLPALITNTTVSFTGTNLPNPFVQSAVDDTGLAQDEIFFPTKAALDAAYANGNFHYVTTFASGNTYVNDLPLGTNGDAYPNAPTLSAPDGDWSAGKLTLHAVTGGYQIGWVSLAAPQDQINLAINDGSGNPITELDGLPGNITNYVLPGSILDPNTDYQIDLTFTHMNYLNTNANGVILYGLFEANNDFTVHTDPAGVAGGVPVSNYAMVRNGTNALVDIDEQAAGYLMAKYSTNGGAAKSYLQFDLTGTNADTGSPATLRLYRASSSASQRIQLWALNQPFSAPTNFNNVNWNQAPANDTNGNGLLTSGPATATLLVDMQAYSTTNRPVYDIVIPAPWGQFVFSNKLTLAIGTSVAIAGDTNATGGFRTVITNSLEMPTLRFSSTAIVPPSITPPVATTLPATGVTASAAALNGTVNPSGAATTWYFQYGTTTNYGTYTTTNSLSADTNTVGVTSPLTGLAAGTTYHCQLVAGNGGGNSSGGDVVLTTLAVTPPQLIAPQILGNGSVQFSFTGTPGATFTILGTTDLTLPVGSWTVLGVATENPAGQYNFTDPQATNNSLRFYEVRSP